MNMIQKRQQMRGQSGFTLIELLVAIAILGVLAGVAVFAVGGLTGQSKAAACDTEAATIKTAAAAANTSTPTNDEWDTFAPGTLKYFDVNVTVGAGTNAMTIEADRLGVAPQEDPAGNSSPLVDTECNDFDVTA
jgi:prepilin-type N-terminal cleavage/methylation domain-containing protein